jgi:hypothetical protein
MSDPRDRLFQVCVVKDNGWTLASELQRDLLQVGLRGGLHDFTADKGGASKCDLVNIHVLRDGGPSRITVSSKNVHDTLK